MYESIEQLKSYFKTRIETRRNDIPPFLIHLAEHAGRSAEEEKGLTEQKEQSLLNALERSVTETFETEGSLIMRNDYEPQGILRRICADAGLSIVDFRYRVGLPTKLSIVISPSSLSLFDDGNPIDLNCH